MDKRGAARYARDNSEPNSTGRCARYVRLALMTGGGLPLADWPTNAKDYRAYLPRYGFVEIPRENYAPELGDVCVLDAPSGVPAAAPGHICIWDGTAWISDFVQRDHWGGPAFRDQRARALFSAASRASSSVPVKQ